MIWVVGTLIGLLLAACVPTVATDYLPLRDKRVVLAIYEPLEAQRICAEYFRLPGSVACVAIAKDEADAKAMWGRYQALQTGLDCVVIAPASKELIDHELTLCGQKAAGYWHRSDQ